MRIRKKIHTVPANSRMGYRQHVVYQPSGNVVENIYYIPSHTEYYSVIQDHNNRSCYPNCGSKMHLYKKEFIYGILNVKNGYDYVSSTGLHTSSYVEGGYIKPYNSFYSVPEVSASGILTNPFATSDDKPIDIEPVLQKFNDQGQAAFKKFRPKLEKLNFIESLSELPSTVKALSLRAFRIQKKAIRYGDGHVAVQFGYLPLVRDIIAFGDIVKNTEMHINRLVKGNGKWLRRSGNLLNESESYSTELSRVNTRYTPSVGVCNRALHTITYTNKTNFVGCFRYYIPGINRRTFIGRVSALSVLTGLRFTPSNMYNAVPWSWLADWCTDAGEWVDQYSSTRSDDCACKYAWLTNRLTAESALTIDMTGSFKSPTSRDISATQASGTSYVRLHSRSRTGLVQHFNFAGGPLSDRQALILHSIARGRAF